jgi:hypothetical protein
MHSRRSRSASPAAPPSRSPALAAGVWELDRSAAAGVDFEVPYWWGPEVSFISESARLDGDTLSVRGELSAGGGRLDIELDASVTPVDDAYELRAETYVMHRWLGMTWNPRWTASSC